MAVTSTTTSFTPGVGSGSSSTRSTSDLPNSWKTTAFKASLLPLGQVVVLKSDIRDSFKRMAHLQTARSFLFAPGSEERKLVRALECGADAVIADLEDAVAPAEKDVARELACRLLGGARRPPCGSSG